MRRKRYPERATASWVSVDPARAGRGATMVDEQLRRLVSPALQAYLARTGIVATDGRSTPRVRVLRRRCATISAKRTARQMRPGAAADPLADAFAQRKSGDADPKARHISEELS